MKNLLVHIGYHKTASTWLQKELFNCDSDFFIPISNRTKGASSLALDFIYGKERYLLNSFDNNEIAIQRELSQILDRIDSNNSKIPVISHERLSGNPHSSGFDSSIIARRLHNFFPNAKILIVIREQSSWLLSNYFRYLTVGGNHSLNKYLNTKYDGKRPGFSPAHLEYHHLIENYQSNFSKENVLVIPYEQLFLSKEVFLKELGNFLDYDLSSIDLDFGRRINETTNYLLNYRLRFLNPFIHSSSVNNDLNLNHELFRRIIFKGKSFLTHMISSEKDKKTNEKLQTVIRKWISDRYDESNKKTSDLIGIDLAKLGYSVLQEQVKSKV